MKSYAFMLLIVASLALSACGGKSDSSSTTTPPPTSYTIGGTISGLSGSGLVLQNNAGDNLSVSANGAFTFKTPMASGGAYKVTVLTQPSTPTQTCAVSSGSGKATAKVTGVQVACTTVTYTIGGTISGLTGTGLILQDNGGDNLSLTVNQTSFTFATQLASGSEYNVTVLTQPNVPAQNCIVTGGNAEVTANVTNVQVACVGEWTWVNGTNVFNQKGTYGSMGTAASSNAPGARFGAISWISANGDLWLSGGLGYDSAGTLNDLNDLWKYSSDEWTWMGGSNVVDEPGTYGTEGVFATSNIPGSRDSAVSWIQPSGTLWVFGGNGLDSNGTAGRLNDLWQFSAGEWTWMNGSSLVDQLGIYGTEETASPGNTPGARSSAASWIDATGDLWLFGGLGYDTDGKSGRLNDLWKYSAGQWAWMGGSIRIGQRGSYGTQGTANPGNVPGARYGAASWTDASGDFWLFGGFGDDSLGRYNVLNDLWKYSAGEWTWMTGSDTDNWQGIYGTQGIAALSNVPGARQTAMSWTDATGNLWLFGGLGLDSVGLYGNLNDLWKYSGGQWTWMGGSNLVDQAGMYGIQGMAAPSNVPGARYSSVGWSDTSGRLWLFGGILIVPFGTPNYISDLWRYQP